MPYQGKSVSLTEMLDILISHGQSEAAAALELERALEDKVIILFLPDGTNDDGEPLYCKISGAGRSAIIALLRDFPNRMRIPSIRSWNAPIAMFAAARALRIEFEAAFGLVEQLAESEKARTKGPAPGTVDRYGESDRARFPEIESLMKAGKTLTAATDELGPTLEGPATPASKARRLREKFQKMKAAN